TVHGRTRNQFYSGKADWNIIKQVKDAVSCVVIGNGDITTGEECERMYNQTGCDLVMVGRASYGKPWVFKEIRHFMLTGEVLPPISLEERMAIMLRHTQMICGYKGENQGMKEARKNIAWYIKGLPKAAEYRKKSGELNKISDLELMIEEILLLNRDWVID
ncbi:MAG: tRNA dihydrouridine synthase DusB, partial [Clostridiales bacterium]|nr:tRNA dihydrouridine synthase DusB [Clostridiales bacterium]